MASPEVAPILPNVARRVAALMADEMTILQSVLEMAKAEMWEDDVADITLALARLEGYRKALQDATTT